MSKATNKIMAAAVPQVDMKYRAEEDLRTLARAQEIQKDKDRMRMCKATAREQIKTLSKVTGGKKR